MAPRTVLVTGANGYIGNATARSFAAAGWLTYGLIRSPTAAPSLAVDEIQPVIGSIDDVSSQKAILSTLPPHLDAIVSTTEDMAHYVAHFSNTVSLFTTLAAATHSATGKKPLVIFTSGCKDYGPGETHTANTPGLRPHTEEDPLNPPAFAVERATNSARIFDYADSFPAVLVRPTNLYGRSSSFYRVFFEAGTHAAAQGGGVLKVAANPAAIAHGMHIDDCGDAYVAIAAHRLAKPEEVEGQVFNIAAGRYETVDQVARALVEEYGLKGGVKYVPKQELKAGPELLLMIQFGFPQWTGSEKLTRVTGWRDRRPQFTEALHVYRLAFEAAEQGGGEMARRNTERTTALGKWLLSTLERKG